MMMMMMLRGFSAMLGKNASSTGHSRKHVF
jgi:hypothetical protein